MEEEFYKDEFEQFLQQQANNHRMYPTDGVWQGIYKKLHGDKKWPALTIAAFAFLTAIIAISVYFSPKPNIFALAPATPPSTAEQAKIPSKTFSNSLTISATDNRIDKANNYVSAEQEVAKTQANEVSSSAVIPVEIPGSLAEIAQVSKPILVNLTNDKKNFQSTLQVGELTERQVNKPLTNLPLVEIQEDPQSTNSTTFVETTPEKQEGPEEKNGASTLGTPNATIPKQDLDDKNMADKFLKEHISDIDLFTTTKKQGPKKKFSYTIYIAPSISYRRLKEEDLANRKDNLNGPVALNYVTDVNKVVRHTPGTGIETGVGFTYHLSNTIGIRGGLQFNIRQYNIEAYKAPGEIATIALLARTNGVDAINSYAVYRNNNGYFSTELVNRHYQISIPVGLQWEVIGNNKVKFNVAATVQPTYITTRNNYLLTTNYKNYTETSAMLRKWNINSNVEAYMSLKVGDYRWQLGPQLRYQHLPTFITEYPIREHLMDYGFKIGVSKVIK